MNIKLKRILVISLS